MDDNFANGQTEEDQREREKRKNERKTQQNKWKQTVHESVNGTHKA